MSDQDIRNFLEHQGVKGMKWGVRRDSKTGIRPSAQALANSRFGKASQKNVDRHNARVTARKNNKADRIDRLKSGKGSLKDKLIRDLDIGGTNTAIKGPPSKQKKAALATAAVVIGGIGVAQLLSARSGMRTSQLPRSTMNDGVVFIARNSKGQIISQFGTALYPKHFP